MNQCLRISPGAQQLKAEARPASVYFLNTTLAVCLSFVIQSDCNLKLKSSPKINLLLEAYVCLKKNAKRLQIKIFS